LDPLASWRDAIKILPKERKAAKQQESSNPAVNSTSDSHRPSRRDAFKIKTVDSFKFTADLPGAIVFDVRDLSNVKAVHGGSFTGVRSASGANETSNAAGTYKEASGGATDDASAVASKSGDAGLSKDLGPCCDNTDCSPGSPSYAGDCNVLVSCAAAPCPPDLAGSLLQPDARMLEEVNTDPEGCKSRAAVGAQCTCSCRCACLYPGGRVQWVDGIPLGL